MYKGEIYMSAGETFDPPDPKPTLFFSIEKANRNPLELNFKVN